MACPHGQPARGNASSTLPLQPQETRMPSLNVNGQVRTHDAEPDTPLLWVLR